jgi:hypothetical protein
VGASYGAALGFDPTGFIGGEIGYSGSANQVAASPSTTLYRNSGYAAVLPGLPIPIDPDHSVAIKPYLLAGLGADGYYTTGRVATGYNSHTVGAFPFGAGAELRAGRLVAEARFTGTYDFSSFNSFTGNPLHYQGQLSLGAGF